MVFEYCLEHGPQWAVIRLAPVTTKQVAVTFPERAASRPALATFLERLS